MAAGLVCVFQNGAENRFKIGLTRGDLAVRKGQLSTGNPTELVLFDSIQTDHCEALEKFLHTSLQTRRIIGLHGRSSSRSPRMNYDQFSSRPALTSPNIPNTRPRRKSSRT